MSVERPVDPRESGFHSVMGYPEMPVPRPVVRDHKLHEVLSETQTVPDVFLDAFNGVPQDGVVPEPQVQVES